MGNPLDVVLVALDYDSARSVADYARRHELTMPVLLGDRRTQEQWRVPGYPTYYVLDSAGRIRQRDFGYSTLAGLLWRTWRAGRTPGRQSPPARTTVGRAAGA